MVPKFSDPEGKYWKSDTYAYKESRKPEGFLLFAVRRGQSFRRCITSAFEKVII
jgi:hypothetical protein